MQAQWSVLVLAQGVRQHCLRLCWHRVQGNTVCAFAGKACEAILAVLVLAQYVRQNWLCLCWHRV